jgi:hypothetical protein
MSRLPSAEIRQRARRYPCSACARAQTGLGDLYVVLIAHNTAAMVADTGDVVRRQLWNEFLDGLKGRLRFTSSSSPAVQCAVMCRRTA